MSDVLNKDLFILAEPIETQFGKVRFLTFMEFLKYGQMLNLMSMNSLHFYYSYKKDVQSFPPKERDEFLVEIEKIKSQTLHELAIKTEAILNAYVEIFCLVLEEEYANRVEDIINDEEAFMGMRQLIMEMNFLTEDPVSPDPEIQSYYEDRKKVKLRESGKQSTSDVITSIVAGTSNSFEDIKKWTVIQVYGIYYRIGAFKNFDTQTLFATVSSDVKIESWSKNIDMFEQDQLGIGYKDFDKQYGGLFN